MVKGLSRRVIVVESPDGELFEQAIFIVREKNARKGAVTEDKLVDEALKVCRNYLHKRENRLPRRSALLWALIGACGVSFIWLLCLLLG